MTEFFCRATQAKIINAEVSFWVSSFGYSLGIWSFALMARLVSKMADAGENHRHLALIGSCDYFFVAH
jgi:hypothetical protein